MSLWQFLSDSDAKSLESRTLNCKLIVFFVLTVDQVTKNKDTRDKLIKVTGEFRSVKNVEI